MTYYYYIYMPLALSSLWHMFAGQLLAQRFDRDESAELHHITMSRVPQQADHAQQQESPAAAPMPEAGHRTEGVDQTALHQSPAQQDFTESDDTAAPHEAAQQTALHPPQSRSARHGSVDVSIVEDSQAVGQDAQHDEQLLQAQHEQQAGSEEQPQQARHEQQAGGEERPQQAQHEQQAGNEERPQQAQQADQPHQGATGAWFLDSIRAKRSYLVYALKVLTFSLCFQSMIGV